MEMELIKYLARGYSKIALNELDSGLRIYVYVRFIESQCRNLFFTFVRTGYLGKRAALGNRLKREVGGIRKKDG